MDNFMPGISIDLDGILNRTSPDQSKKTSPSRVSNSNGPDDHNTAALSIYLSTKNIDSKDTIPMDIFLDGVKNGVWRKEVSECQSMSDRALRREYKSNKTPCVTLAGTFKTRRDSDLEKHSGYIGMDIDDLAAETQKTKMLLSHDPYVYAVFKSISGNGLCVIFRIDAEKHRDAFAGLAFYLLEKYKLVADSSCVNPSRARFVSYDPDLYLNEKAPVFKKYLPKPKKRKISQVVFVEDEFENVIRQMVDRNVSCVEDYRDWLTVSFGLADKFGESGRSYFHHLSAISTKYNPETCDRQFNEALNRNGRGGNKVTIATIYYFAKQAGIDITSQTTKKIISVTSSAKKSGVRPDSIIKNLEKFAGITPTNEVKEIVQQAYDNNVQSSESLVEDVKTWLTHTHDLKRNELTRKIENTGRVIDEVGFNTLFLEAKIIFDKLTFELFMRIIFSHNTLSYNPAKEHIESIEWDETKRLDVIGKCINSETGDLNWRCTMVRKWLIGIVSSIYGGTNELMLILVGGKNTGKTEFIKKLLPVPLKNYFALSQLNRGKDDEILMCEKLIILNDEYGGKNKMDERNEKRLMAADRFDLRVPYGKGNETIQRIASLCGTCNDISVLDDPTGNRRIIVMESSGKFDYALYNSIDKDQLFAEALAAYREGERPFLSDDDIFRLEEHTDGKYSKVSEEKELIEKYFYTPPYAADSDFLTATEIKLHLEQYTKGSINVNKVGSQLRKIGYKRKTQKGLWGYEIVKKPSPAMQSNYSSYAEQPNPF
jgi:predicted P-loop ATPase